MLKKRYIILAVVLLSSLGLLAQRAGDPTEATTEQILADIFEQVSENSDTELDFSALYEDLIELSENPINLNNTNKQELEKLQFLTDVQIDNLLYYLYRNGPMNSIFELKLIDGLDMSDIRLMFPFVTVVEKKRQKNKKIRLKNVFRYGKNKLFFRVDRGLETKEGYRFLPEEDEQNREKNEKKYLGNPFYTNFKYQFNYKKNIAFGLTAEKDAGEQFWGDEHKGYDFYSAYFQLKDIGHIKTLVLGDYRANFAQGLVLRTDFSMGKSSYVLQVNPRATGLKKSSSTAEYNYFRGGGITLKLGNFDITSFYSNRNIDGDTTGGTFSSLNNTGLHRTKRDLDRKGNINMQSFGGNITFRYKGIEIGATGVHTELEYPLAPAPTLYNRFYLRGKNQTAGSINYRFRWNKLRFMGESAMSNQKGFATTNTLYFSPVSTVSLVALYRYFSKDYDTFYATSFSETSRINNETGVYMGAVIHPIKKWKISAYIDSYRFPWIKYQISKPSTIGRDYLMQVDYAFSHNVNMYWRFKYEEKMKNYSDTTAINPIVVAQPKWQARYHLAYRFGNFKFKNQFDFNGFEDGVNKPTFGFSALQDINYQFNKIPLKLNCRFQVFDAPKYANRLYIYESDVLYAFSVPMAYGLGTRYYLNARYTLNRHLSLWLKLAQTVYADDRDTISSNNEAIDGKRKTDFRFLVRWKF